VDPQRLEKHAAPGCGEARQAFRLAQEARGRREALSSRAKAQGAEHRNAPGRVARPVRGRRGEGRDEEGPESALASAPSALVALLKPPRTPRPSSTPRTRRRLRAPWPSSSGPSSGPASG